MTEVRDLAAGLVGVLGPQTLYAGILLILAAGAELVARGRWLRLRHAFWSLVVLRLLLPPTLASPLSARSLVEVSGVGRWLLDVLGGGVADPSGGMAASGSSATMVPAAGAASLWTVLAAVAWLAGAVATLVMVLQWRLYTRRLVTTSRPVRRLRCLAAGERWRALLGIRRPVRLLASPSCRSPFTVGTVRPVVVLPEVMAAAWPDELLEPVLGHELAHVARWDDLWVRLVNLAQVLFFFHPAVWVATRRLTATREALCDELVVARGGIAPRQYCRSLVEQARWQVFGTRPESALSLAETGEEVKRRVKRMLESEAEDPARRWRLWLAVGVTAMLLLPMAPGRTAGAGAADPGSRRGVDDPTAEAARAATVTPRSLSVSVPAEDASGGGGPIPFRRGGGLAEPRRIAGPRPEYTAEARAAGVQGVVILRAIIDASGRVTGVTVLRGLPHGLTETAAAALWQWRFAPATRGGEPVAVIYVLTIRFSLDPPVVQGSAA